MTEELKIKIGQMLMAGFPTPEADEQAHKLVEKLYVGNFVLFARNFVSCRQTGKMCEELSKLAYDKTGYAPLISADQEGGSTCRMHEGAAMFAGSMAAAAADADTRWLGNNCGTVLRALGVNTNLAPVMDVNSNPMNPIIGVRSFGDTAEKVKHYGIPELKGMQEAGVLATVKHFPGHGNVQSDSHLTVPSNPAPARELYDIDFEPFRAAFAEGADSLMSCHVVFPSLDSENPATLSKRIMTELLRDEMKFEGIAMTDCLEMGAIGSTYGPGEGAVRAVEAGCDVLCISHTYEAVSKAAHALWDAVESGRLSEERINLSYERIMKVKKKYSLLAPFVFDEEKACAIIEDKERIAKNREISRASITCVRNDRADIIELLKKDPVFVSPCALALTGVDDVTKTPANFAKAARERFGGKAVVLPVDKMDEASVKEVENADGSVFVVGLYNARFHEGQLEALRLVNSKNRPVIAVMFSGPYDVSIADGADMVIAAYEYTPLSMDAVLDSLECGIFAGRLPVKL